MVSPFERQIIRTNDGRGIDERVNDEQYLRDRVTTCRRSVTMCVGTTGGARLTEEVVCLTLIDIMALVMVVRIVHRQVQLNNRVTTGCHRCECIDIDTAFP